MSNDKIVLYSGAIGEKQGLQTLLLSADALRFRSDIKFIICGSGPYKDKLIYMAKDLELNNVIFLPLQPEETFNQFLNIAHVHLILQKSSANDLMLPSKLATILSVGGLSLVTAEPESTLHSLITANNIGILLEPDNPSALSSAILEIIDKPNFEIKSNARKYAELNLSLDSVVSSFFDQLSINRS